jgi:hypothetical protein
MRLTARDIITVVTLRAGELPSTMDTLVCVSRCDGALRLHAEAAAIFR